MFLTLSLKKKSDLHVVSIITKKTCQLKISEYDNSLSILSFNFDMFCQNFCLMNNKRVFLVLFCLTLTCTVYLKFQIFCANKIESLYWTF